MGIRDEDPYELFELGDFLGKGTYAQVFKGIEKATGKSVAIK